MFAMFKQMFGGGGDYFGERLKVPDLPSMSELMQEYTTANTANMPALQEQAAGINKFNYGEIRSMMEKTLPGFFDSLGKAGANANDMIAGKIPTDVSNSVWNSSAARALGGGFGGSGAGRNLTARDLGTTSLGLQQQGQNSLMNIGSFAQQLTPTFDFTSMFMSPAMAMQWSENQFQRNLLQAKSDASPDPTARGRADQEMALFGMIASMYSGGPGYTQPSSAARSDLGSSGWGAQPGAWGASTQNMPRGGYMPAIQSGYFPSSNTWSDGSKIPLGAF